MGKNRKAICYLHNVTLQVCSTFGYLNQCDLQRHVCTVLEWEHTSEGRCLLEGVLWMPTANATSPDWN